MKMEEEIILIAIALVVVFIISAIVFIRDYNYHSFLKERLPDYQSTPPAPAPLFHRIYTDFFEVTLQRGEKETVAISQIFIIKPSGNGGTIIMSAGGVCFTCMESYEKIKTFLE